MSGNTRLLCPACGTALVRGYGRRAAGNVVRRRRDCPGCKTRYNTAEEIVGVNRKPLRARSVARHQADDNAHA